MAIAIAVFFVLFWSRGASAEANSPLPESNVLVFNYSKAADSVVTQAEREAGRIFGQSGIHLAWTNCPVWPKPNSLVACEGEPAPGEIRVRILEHDLNHAFQTSIFGYAIAPVFASVYYESALRLAQTTTNSGSDIFRREIEAPIILGSLIAHEIGHLLLRQNQHTASGIMRARWEIREIQLAVQGGLLFTPEQSGMLRRNARLRAR